jgi:hypothetical protein
MEKLSILFINPIFKICLLLITTITIPSIFNNQAIAQDTIFDKHVSNYDSLVDFLFFIIFIIGIIYIIWKITHRSKKRRYFSADIKRQILKEQNNKCAICKKNKGIWDYDHIDGNRSNNSISNCQALCPDCHAKKTRGLLKVNRKSNSKWKTIIVMFVILIVIVFLLKSI